MTVRTERSRIQKILDAFLFPVRALFIPENSYFGLTSLRDERMSTHVSLQLLPLEDSQVLPNTLVMRC